MMSPLFSEDESLEDFIKEKIAVSVYLVNGIRLTGVIGGFDEDSILLHNLSNSLIYKHAISTITPY